MKYSWTTSRGSKISLDIDVKIAAQKHIWADGNDFTVPCHEWHYTINSLLVNGMEMADGAYLQQIGRWPEDVHYAYGMYALINGKKQQAFVEIPDEIYAEIYGPEAEYKKAKLEKELAVEEACEAHYNAVMDMLNK